MSKNKKFSEQLRVIAELLKPFTLFKKGKSQNENFLLPAVYWKSKLSTMADLLEPDDVKISPSQKEYLQRNIFGTMGSLNDFSLGDRELKDRKEQEKFNNRLEVERGRLYEIFKGL